MNSHCKIRFKTLENRKKNGGVEAFHKLNYFWGVFERKNKNKSSFNSNHSKSRTCDDLSNTWGTLGLAFI